LASLRTQLKKATKKCSQQETIKQQIMICRNIVICRT